MTPGPWIVEENVPSQVINNRGSIVVDTANPHLSGEEQCANARLIAQAPEMLLLLREWLEMASRRVIADPRETWFETWVQRVNAVVVKATR